MEYRSCPDAQSKNDTYSSKEEAQNKCKRQVSECRFSGFSDMQYACLREEHKEPHTVYGTLNRGGFSQIIAPPSEKTQK